MANAAGDNALCGQIQQQRKANQDVQTWKLSHKAWQIFDELRQNQLFFDVVLKTDDNKLYSAHKIVLCTCGQYFRLLFSGRWNCSNKSEVRIPGIKSKILENVMEFAYKREISLTSISEAKELLIAANQLGLDDIISICSSYIKSKINHQNALDVWCFSKDFFCKLLEESSFLYILNHFVEIVGNYRHNGGNMHFTKLNSEDVKTIIESDELYVDSELVVFQALMKWVRQDSNERKKMLYDLMCSVRLGLMRRKHLQMVVGTDKFVLSCQRTKRLVNLHLDIFATKKSLALSSLSNTFSPRTLSVIQRTLRPRYPHKLVLVVGGWSGDSPTNITEAYEPLTESWFDISPTLSPILTRSRAYHGIAYNKGHIYMVGGFDGEVTFRSCDRFQLSSWSWKAMKGMNQKRCYVATAILDDLIYAIGGSSGNNGVLRLRSAEVFNPYLNSWTMLPDMSEHRSDAGACAFNTRIYVVGGFTGHQCVFSAEFYEPELKQWTNITPMRIPRSGVSVLAYQGRILAIGGFDGKTSRLNSVECFNTTTNTWAFLPHMLVGRSNFGACVVDGKIIAIGGYDGNSTCSKVECYDDDDDAIASSFGRIKLRQKRANSRDFDTARIYSSDSDDSECDDLPRERHSGGSGDDEVIDNSEVGQNIPQLRPHASLRGDISVGPGAWRHLPNMEMPRSALSCCVISDASPRFLKSIITVKKD